MQKIELITTIMMIFLSTNIFMFKYKYILLNLIILEFMIINLLMYFYYLMNYLNLNIFFITFFMIITVCESIFGLTILVYMIRINGNNKINMINLMKF